jgi:putative spermidine/putrescine transport system substrate-binding protein
MPAPVERRPAAMISSVLAVVLAITVMVSWTGLQPATPEARAHAGAPGRPSARASGRPTLAPLPTSTAVPNPTSTPLLEWPAEPVVERARAEGHTFATYHMPDSWANYGQAFTTFCEQVLGFDCNSGRTRSLGEDMASAEVISAFANEGSDARAALGDIWSLTIADAAASGALAPYTSPRARALPVSVRGDGWVSPFAGVPGFIVNRQQLAYLHVPVPHAWAELAKPIYRGLVGMGTPGLSPSGTAAFLALSLGHGGTLTDYAPIRTLARALAANMTDPPLDMVAFQAGNPPIDVDMDFDLVWANHVVSENGMLVEVVIPTDGSLYLPATVIANGFDTAHMDVTKLFMDWLLSDVGQSIFAQYGAHPIRSVVGDTTYVIPPPDRDLLLSDAHYAMTKLHDLSAVDLDAIYRFWTTAAGGS